MCDKTAISNRETERSRQREGEREQVRARESRFARVSKVCVQHFERHASTGAHTFSFCFFLFLLLFRMRNDMI